MSYVQEQVQLAMQVYKKGELAKAMEILNQVLPEVVGCGQLLYLTGIIEYQMGRYPESKASFERALSITPQNPSLLGKLCMLEIIEENYSAARVYYEKAMQVDPNEPALQDVHHMFKKSRIPLEQAILVNTLPKSGSLYLWHSLFLGLSLPRTRVGSEYFAVRKLVKDAVKRSAVALGHLYAVPENCHALIEGGISKMVLQLRDPRAALLSWVYQLDRLFESGKYAPVHYELVDGYFDLSYEEQALCPQYYQLDFQEKVDLHIERYLPWQVKWTKDWLAIADNPNSGLDILVTHYSDLVEKPKDFFNQILKFYGIDSNCFKFPENTDKGQLESGGLKGWRQFFSLAQKDRADEFIDADLKQRMNWSD